jgi:hypothetical protein
MKYQSMYRNNIKRWNDFFVITWQTIFNAGKEEEEEGGGGEDGGGGDDN